MSEEPAFRPASFQVLVIDMAHYADGDSEIIISGFPNREEAIDYARRRLRDSIEELRKARQSSDELRKLWSLFGEDVLVIGEPAYSFASDLPDFFAHPASAEERDWQAIEKRLGNLIIQSSRQ
jgi:hypothetical protein